MVNPVIPRPIDTGIYVGAYAIAPGDPPLVGASEERWYEALAGIEGASGLETPYDGGLHPEGVARLARLLPADWSVIVTLVPLSMAGIGADARYGLSSDDAEGRRVALDELRSVHAAVRELEDSLGRSAVHAVHLTSAPRARAAASGAASLAASLEEIAGWGWGSTALVVEHCDAPAPGREPEKGFLDLEAEIDAVVRARAATTGARIGQTVNWGRSAIEGRSARTPVDHLARLTEAGTLAGLFLSGASASGGRLGGPWADVHDPASTVEPASLLTSEAIAAAVAAAGPTAYLGVKVKDPAGAADPLTRLTPLRETVRLVREAALTSRAAEGGATGSAPR